MSIKIDHTTIKVKGLKKQYKFMQISDLHILKTDERDGTERQNGYRQRAEDYFTYNGIPSYDFLPMFLECAKKENALPVFTGDTVDMPTECAFEILDKFLPPVPNSFFILGNHDWTFMDYYHGINKDKLKKDDFWCEEYYKNYYSRFKKYAIDGNLNSQAIELDEIIYAGFDTGNDKFDQEQYEFFLNLTKKGKPIIIFCHTPFFCETLHQPLVERWGEAGAESTVINGKRCPMDEYTKKFYQEMLKPENQVVAVVAGHNHLQHDDLIEGKIWQYSAAGAYEGFARIFTVEGDE